MNRQRFSFLIVLVLAVALFAAGCGRVELHRDLTEEDANEIMVLLAENDIKADKKREVRQNVVSFIIEVRESDMVKARSLLVKHNLPRRKELGLTGVYKEKGLIPTPDEQKARFLLAIKGEIINSLERLPQIVDADVVLNIPTKDEFADAEVQYRQRPTASTIVRLKPDIPGVKAVTEAKIQQFVANAVEGMNPRDVTVILSYLGEEAMPPRRVRRPAVAPAPGVPPEPGKEVTHELMGLTLDARSKGRLKIYLLIFFLLLIFLSAALIVVIIQGGRMRKTLSALKGPVGEHPAIEGQILEEGEPRLEEGEPPAEEL